jgi:hypothetical protein
MSQQLAGFAFTQDFRPLSTAFPQRFQQGKPQDFRGISTAFAQLFIHHFRQTQHHIFPQLLRTLSKTFSPIRRPPGRTGIELFEVLRKTFSRRCARAAPIDNPPPPFRPAQRSWLCGFGPPEGGAAAASRPREVGSATEFEGSAGSPFLSSEFFLLRSEFNVPRRPELRTQNAEFRIEKRSGH